MATKIQVLSHKINDQFCNGWAHTVNPDTDYSPNLMGSAGELVLARTVIQVHTYFSGSTTNKIQVQHFGAYSTLSAQSCDWIAEGFSAGDEIHFLGYSPSPEMGAYATVTSASPDTLVVSPSLSPYPEGSHEWITITNVTPLRSLEYSFGLLGNKETFNNKSKFTGEFQKYYARGIGEAGSTAFVSMQPAGPQRGWVSGYARARFIGYMPISGMNAAAQQFEIEHEFAILPHYVEGEAKNLKNGIPPKLFAGDATLKYAFQASFSGSLNSPTGAKSAKVDYILGSVGWFGEACNGQEAGYEIAGVAYSDPLTLSPLSALRSTGATRVTVTARKKSGAFGADTAGVYASYLAPSSRYSNSPLTADQSLMQSRAFCPIGGTGAAGGSVSNLSVTAAAPDTLSIVFELEHTAGDKAYLAGQDSPEYLVAVQLGDNTLPLKDSDKVMLIADCRAYSNAVDIEGLAYPDALRIWRHGLSADTDTPRTGYAGWIEDGVLSELDFSLDLSRGAEILSIAQKLVAYNGTGHFDLDSTTIPLGAVTVQGGVQRIEAGRDKPYPLADADPYKSLYITTLGRVGDLQGYRIRAGQKLTWQDWQAAPAPGAFYDRTKPNSGLNRKASNYDAEQGYTVRLAYCVTLSGFDAYGRKGITEYAFLSPAIPAEDYGQPDGWSWIIACYDLQTGASLEARPYANKPCLFRITWNKSGYAPTDVEGVWAINRIEQAGQPGMAKHEISNLVLPASDSPLQPLPGYDRLRVYKDGTSITCECVIDPSAMDMSAGVNLSGRISLGAPTLPAGVKITQAAVPKMTQSGLYKIIQ